MAELFRSKDEEIFALRLRVKELEEKICDLEFEIQSKSRIEEHEAVAIISAFGITVAHARILRLLSTGRPVTRERLFDEYAADSTFEIRNVDSQIKRIRQRNLPIRIRTIYGYGYQCTPESAATLRSIIAAAKRQHKQQKNIKATMEAHIE